MTITPFNWQDEPQLLEVLKGNVAPSSTSPLSAAGLAAFEAHLAAYTESIAAGGIELGYAEITTSPATVTTVTDITGLEVTVTVGTRPIEIILYTYTLYNTSTGNAILAIQEGATQLQMGATLALGANKGHPATVIWRGNPSAGSHTYKATLARGGAAGNAGMAALTTAPAFIQVKEV